MVRAMTRSPLPRGRLLSAGLLIVAVLTLLGHVCTEWPAGPVAAAHDTHHRGPAEVPDSAHAVLCAVTLSATQSGCPMPSHAAAPLLAPAPSVVAAAAARISRTGAAHSARTADGSPPLFLLHATFLI